MGVKRRRRDHLSVIARAPLMTLAASAGGAGLSFTLFLSSYKAITTYSESASLVGWGSDLPWWPFFLAAIVFEQSMNVMELIIRRRRPAETQDGWTFPMIFIPGGRILRGLLLVSLLLPLLSLKLSIYLFTFALSPLYPIFGGLGLSLGRAIDVFDDRFERIEYGLNRTFNALHYCKIDARGSVFSTLFNTTLPMWCINH